MMIPGISVLCRLRQVPLLVAQDQPWLLGENLPLDEQTIITLFRIAAKIIFKILKLLERYLCSFSPLCLE